MRCRVGHYTPPRFIVDYLVVAGGGSGGSTGSGIGILNGGGGGAGGVLQGMLRIQPGAAVTVTVGAGGVPSGGNDGSDGQNSALGDLVAVGGGGGGQGGQNGRAGGSGGGGGAIDSGSTSGGAATSGQGNAGQSGSSSGGDGGSFPPFGLYSVITGTAGFYAFGGGAWVGELPPNSGHGGEGGRASLTGGIVVSGAGTSAANGVYTISGTSFLDSPEYRLGTTDYYIRNNGSTWDIVDDDGLVVMYTLNVTPADPSAYNPFLGPYPQGPATAVNGAAPAPTISNQVLSASPDAGADGIVVIAYPSTQQPLTVGSGLAYDEPTRAGYRVYRFTGGTGTVTFP